MRELFSKEKSRRRRRKNHTHISRHFPFFIGAHFVMCFVGRSRRLQPVISLITVVIAIAIPLFSNTCLFIYLFICSVPTTIANTMLQIRQYFFMISEEMEVTLYACDWKTRLVFILLLLRFAILAVYFECSHAHNCAILADENSEILTKSGLTSFYWVVLNEIQFELICWVLIRSIGNRTKKAI